MPNARIVDCHHHLWDLDKHQYEWLQTDAIFDTFIGDYSPICRNYLIEDYLEEARPVGLSKSVHIQCEFDPSNPVGETEWLQAIADQHGFPHGIVGWANLAQPDVHGLLESHAQFPNFRGIRQNLNWDDGHPDRSFADRGDYLEDDAWWRGFALLERFDMSFDLQILPHQMRQAWKAVANHPDTAVVLDHVGLPIDRTAEAMGLWRDGMRLLASLPNMAVKLSGFTMIDHDLDLAKIRPIILETIDIFGVDRCMFASNFPVDGLHASYAQLYSAFAETVAQFNSTERQALFAGNAERFYRLRH